MPRTEKTTWARRLGVMLLALLMTLTLGLTAACDNGEEQEEGTTYVLSDPQWDSVQFHNSVASIILKQGYDIDTEVVTASTPITWQSLKSGEIQIYMEVWSENLPTYQEYLDSGDVIELGVNFADNAQGLYVPRYVIEGDPDRGIEAVAPDLTSIQDLVDDPETYKEVFQDPDDPDKGRIYGAIPGWEVDTHLRNKFEAYGLDEHYKYFSPGSDPALSASLASAYEAGEPWCGYYWEPTWVSGKYDIVLLEDTPFTTLEDMQAGYNEFPSNRVTICIHKSVQENDPDVADMLSRYETSSQLTAEALAYMQQNDASKDETAVWFLKEHSDLLREWVADDEVYEQIMDYVDGASAE